MVTVLRYLTAGESHGPCLTAIIEGIPSGLNILKEGIDRALARRQQGYGRGGRMRIERDQVEILSGIRFGQTLGSPITLQIRNKDWENWQERMAAFGAPAGPEINQPRPGHADLTGMLAYRRRDARDILERASARETAARVAVGAIAQQLLAVFGVRIYGQVINIGGIVSQVRDLKDDCRQKRMAESQLACLDPAAEAKMIEAIDQAKRAGDTLGGTFEIIAEGLPPGLGTHVQWDRKLDGRLAQALMSIQGIKGVEVGLGLAYADHPGSRAHDEIFCSEDRGYFRQTNRAGGIEGGYSNGEPIIVRAAMKPIPTLMKPLQTVDTKTKQPVMASTERSDVCAVPAALVVGEAAVAITLADALLERFGCYSMAETQENFKAYINYLRGEKP
ncbi:MAG TPA: chorismate synthase [Negativicutes bacterium]|nr:chorismate synthase [Negativicutes bacterium]